METRVGTMLISYWYGAWMWVTFRIARVILGMDTIEDTKSKIWNVFPNRHHTITAPDFRISNWACRETNCSTWSTAWIFRVVYGNFAHMENISHLKDLKWLSPVESSRQIWLGIQTILTCGPILARSNAFEVIPSSDPEAFLRPAFHGPSRTSFGVCC